MPRLPDWDRRLARVTEKHLRMPGVWGESDCLLTVADAIEAVTGKDHAAKVRGKYSTPAGAAKLMKRRKCDTVEDVLAKLFPETGRLLARRGDVGTVELDDGSIAAGYVTEYGVAVKGERGLRFVPQTMLRKAFRVE